MGFFDEIDNFLSMGGSKKASKAADKISQPFDNIQAPELTPYDYEQLVSTGEMTPQMAELIKGTAQTGQASLVGPSAFGGISLDPATREAQMAALRDLQGIADQGMSDQQKFMLAKVQADQGASDRGNQMAILQNAAQRGVAGSGLEMMNRMNAQQQGANNRNLQDLQIAAMGDQNKMAALQQIGALGGNIRGADYQQEAAKASAMDMISKFNANNTQNMSQFNTNAVNDMTKMNTTAGNNNNQFNTGIMNEIEARKIAERQRIADTNVGLKNAGKDLKYKDLPQQNFTNKMGIAGGQTGAYGQQASIAQQEAEAKRKQMGNLIQLGASAAGVPSTPKG